MESIEKQSIFEYGEYVACVWYDDGLNCVRWYLGVVDGMNNGEALISYMKVSDKKWLKGLFPAKAEIQSIKCDQIFLHLSIYSTLSFQVIFGKLTGKMMVIEVIDETIVYLYSQIVSVELKMIILIFSPLDRVIK